jgi:CheY-like chemotaxis protein
VVCEQVAEVFLVDDNPADVALIRVILSGVGFPLRLLVAKDGEQALQMLGFPDFRPQLIILDLNMPRVDGQTVLKEYGHQNVPIVVFSSTENKIEIQRALVLGAREYVQKPIGLEAYAAAVRGIVNRWIPHVRESAGSHCNRLQPDRV